jgi:sugar phosphate isomerase/epimerase
MRETPQMGVFQQPIGRVNRNRGSPESAMTPIHVNVPYPMLLERVGFVIQKGLHPEIFFGSDDLDTYREKDARDLAETLRSNGREVTFHGPFMDLSPGAFDRRIREVTVDRLSKALELAGFFKPRTIVFHPGYEKWKYNGNARPWLESSLETWRPLAEKAGEMGVTLALENVYEESPEPLRLLLEEIDSPSLRFCFDTGHHHVFGKTPLLHWFETLGKYLAEVHLHDNHKELDEHLPIGEGGFDFEQFFKLLSVFKLDPIYTIEPHQEDHLWRGLKAAKRYLSAD